MTQQPQALHESFDIIEVPLNKLKKSPRNARRVPHGEAEIEALAASIAAKGVLQAPVVEPETDGDGSPTGFYLVTIGEGRRVALARLAKAKVIKKAEPIRCVVDLTNDPLEISLDENVTRSAMHPADQFEAFRDLNERKGWGAEEIAARFGVTPQVVRQRLRLGAVSPRLIALYREERLTLDQLMAFGVSEDHARQEQVLEQYGDRPAYVIRRAMTEAKVSAQDRRAVLVGAEAYAEAGGKILRDLFTEDGGGWFEDPALLDRLASAKLAELAEEVREREGWKWAEGCIDYPHMMGLSRVYPHAVERSEAEAAEMSALGEEYDAIVSQHDGAEEWPPEVEARLSEIEAALEAFGDGYAYEPDEIARAGVFVILGQDGVARMERGLVRPEDVPVPEPEPEAGAEGETASASGEAPEEGDGPAEDEGEADAPLSEALVLDLTAQRTAALRDALAADPTLALCAVVHSLAQATFYEPHLRMSCLEIKPTTAPLANLAPGLAESRAGRSIAERHDAWASRLPRQAEELWTFVLALGSGELLELLAHCASQTVNAIRWRFDRRPGAWAHADRLADALGLDMAAYWSPSVESYLGRVTKAKIAEAVREGVSPEAAERITAMKKPDMAAEAETLLAGKGWVPSLLRSPDPVPEVQPEAPISQEAA